MQNEPFIDENPFLGKQGSISQGKLQWLILSSELKEHHLEVSTSFLDDRLSSFEQLEEISKLVKLMLPELDDRFRLLPLDLLRKLLL